MGGAASDVCSSVVGVVVSEGLVLPVDEGWLLLAHEYDELPPLCVRGVLLFCTRI